MKFKTGDRVVYIHDDDWLPIGTIGIVGYNGDIENIFCYWLLPEPVEKYCYNREVKLVDLSIFEELGD